MIPSLEDKDRVALRALRTKPSSRNANYLSDVYISKPMLFLTLIENSGSG